jgi:hypothetical protein
MLRSIDTHSDLARTGGIKASRGNGLRIADSATARPWMGMKIERPVERCQRSARRSYLEGPLKGGSMARTTFAAPLVALLSACSDGTPVSPIDDRQAGLGLASSTRRTIAIELHNNARLRRVGDGQQFVEISLRARCPEGYVMLEEPLTLTQGDLAFGQGGFGMSCTGRWERRTFRVFSTGEVEFRRGRASANVALQVENLTTGDLLVASDREILKLH